MKYGIKNVRGEADNTLALFLLMTYIVARGYTCKSFLSNFHLISNLFCQPTVKGIQPSNVLHLLQGILNSWEVLTSTG